MTIEVCTVMISNKLRGPVRQLTCPQCKAALPTLWKPIAVRIVPPQGGARMSHTYVSEVRGYSGYYGDVTLAYNRRIPAPLLCCSADCEKRFMTRRRLHPIVVDAVIDDETKKAKRRR